MPMKYLTFIVFSVSIIMGCKSGKRITHSTTNIDSLLVNTLPDSIPFDTVVKMQEEIDLEIFRVYPDTVTIAAVGDIMPGTNFPDQSYLPRDSGEYLWDDVRSQLKQADITFGNLEGTILNEGGDQKECNNPKLCYLFRSPEYLAKNFSESGFDLMSVANNHANDFGDEGRLNTQRVLDSLHIGHAGSIDQPYLVKKIGHLKVGFCAFAPNRGTMSIHNYEQIIEIIQHLDSISDFVIVSLHIGAEGAKNRHVTKEREFYYGEDRGNAFELSHLLIDHGADVVLGHGPHVVRAMEVYKKRIIAYSLGNFLTYGRFNLKGYAGEAPILEIKINSKGEFLSGKVHAFRQSYTYGPIRDSNLSTVKTIQALSLEDFPDNPIFISDTGEINYLVN